MPNKTGIKIFFSSFVIFCTFLLRPNADCLKENTTSNRKIENKFEETVPGCPDLGSIESTVVNNFNTNAFQRLSCLCGPSAESDATTKSEKNDDVFVTCIYGSSLNDLDKTLGLVRKANKTVSKILLDHLEITSNRTLMKLLSTGTLLGLEYLEIRRCRGEVLDMSEREAINHTSSFLFPKLKVLEIENCEMEGMPAAVLINAPNMQRLVLKEAKLKVINKRDLERQAKNLTHLDLSSNLLQSASTEAGSLAQLKSLKRLIIGEHNSASKALFKEIENMSWLEELDLTRIDGIESMTQMTFSKENKLRRLTLMGCNLRFLNRSAFSALNMLESLDLRVNLIEKIERGCFMGLDRLQSLSLAGNFISDIPEIENGTNFWSDMPSLVNLDIGWNEIRRLNKTTFSGISNSLKRLSLRNNEELFEIETETFSGMNVLEHLNMSGTHMKKVRSNMFAFPKLKELDISYAKIEEIDPKAFEKFKNTIELVDLSRNKLKTVDEQLFKQAASLTSIDISQNEWLCDVKLYKVITVIEEMYKNSQKNSTKFELKNSGQTVCKRPYLRGNQSIFELLKENATNLVYNELQDTTTTHPQTTTTLKGESLGVKNIAWKPPESIVIGEGVNEHFFFNKTKKEKAEEGLIDKINNEYDDEGKPRYDINDVQYGEKIGSKKDTNTWVGGVVITILIIVTAVCIIVVIRRKNINSEKENKSRPNIREAITSF